VSLVRLHDVTVDFGGHRALQGASLAVERGEVLALVGANGSGKTTLLRVLHGLLQAPGRQAGEPGVAQAMVFQRPFLLHLSVHNNLRLALWLAGVPRAEWAARVDEALRRVGLDGLQARPARALSGGQQQRLALARALARRPQLLFLDEPTANLDPAAKREIEALLATLAAGGMTLVMSTHNLGQAKRLANRVVYLEQGRIHADLPTDAFFHVPLSGPAQQFLKGERT
jgi:tungstate transport system ATP-binding protein